MIEQGELDLSLSNERREDLVAAIDGLYFHGVPRARLFMNKKVVLWGLTGVRNPTQADLERFTVEDRISAEFLENDCQAMKQTFAYMHAYMHFASSRIVGRALTSSRPGGQFDLYVGPPLLF